MSGIKQQTLISYLSGIFFAVLVVAGLAVVAATFSTYSNLPGFYKVYLVQSGSMSPVIKTGDMILVKPSDKYFLKDIITFKDEFNQVVTHRVQKVQGSGASIKFLTKGDANKVVDNKEVPVTQVIGKVSYVIPYLGYLIVFAKSLPGLVVFILIPALAIIISELITIFKSLSQA